MEESPRKIALLGHNKSERNLDTPAKFVEFIRTGILIDQHGRYRRSRRVDADVIVMSRNGVIYGHLEIDGHDKPNDQDRLGLTNVEDVLLVRRTWLFDRWFKCSAELGFWANQGTLPLTESQFDQIQHAGRGSIVFGDAIMPEEVPQSPYSEGQTQQVLVNRWERDQDAVRGCKRTYGTTCVACEVDLGSIYGDIGKGYVHVHHLIPGSARKFEHPINPAEELRPVCPNCHAMIHRYRPPYTIDELRQRIRTRFNKSA